VPLVGATTGLRRRDGVLRHPARVGEDEAVQEDAGTSATTGAATWSVPGSQAEPDPPVAPLEAPPGRQPGPDGRFGPGGGVGVGGAGPQDRMAGDGRRSFAPTGLLAEPDDLTERSAVPTVRLRPMTIADILDGAFGIIKVRPTRILGLVAVFVVPIHLAIAFVERNAASGSFSFDALTSDDPAVVAETSQDTTSAAQLWALGMRLFLPSLALMFVAVAVAHLVAAWSVGRDVPTGQLLRLVARRWWAVVVTFIVIHVLEAVGFAGFLALAPFSVGGLFVMAAFVVTAPVIGAEGLGPLKALNRAASLAMRRFFPTLGISLAIGLVAFLLGSALGGLPLLIAVFLDFHLAWPLQAAGSILGALVTTPFVATATALLYLDLRIRTEGLDIELAAAELAPVP